MTHKHKKEEENINRHLRVCTQYIFRVSVGGDMLTAFPVYTCNNQGTDLAFGKSYLTNYEFVILLPLLGKLKGLKVEFGFKQREISK